MRIIRQIGLPLASTELALALAIALAVALWAQTRLPGDALQAGVDYAAAAALFLLAVARAGREHGSRFEAAGTAGRPLRLLALIAAAALLPSIAALGLFRNDELPNLVIALWGISIALALYGAWRLDRGEPAVPQADAWTRLEVAVFLSLVILAAFLRVWRIWDFPGVYEDEGSALMDAHSVWHGRISTPFVSGEWQTGTLFHYPLAGLMAVGVHPILALKLMGIIPGTLTGAFLYLFLREAFGRVAAIVGTALLATSSWHILVSRWGYERALDTLVIVMALYFIVRGLRTRDRLDFGLAGVALSLGLVVTKSAATAPLLIAGVGIFFLVRYGWGAAKTFGQHFVLLALLIVLVAAPRALYIAEDPSTALLRQREVFLFSKSHWADQKKEPLEQTVRNMRELFLTFNYKSGYEARWNARPLKPALDVVSGALLVLGLAYGLFRVRQLPYFLLLMTTLAIVVPASTTLALDDRPVSYRIYGVIPAVYGFASLPLWLAWRAQRAPPGRAAVALAAVVLVGVSAYLNYDAYFGQYGTSNKVYHSTGQVETRVARHIESLADDYDVYLTTGEVFYPTIERITRDRVTYRAIDTIDDILTVGYEGRPLAFVVVLGNKWSNGTFGEALLVVLRSIYPEGREVQDERDPAGKIVFETYYVDVPPEVVGQATAAGGR